MAWLIQIIKELKTRKFTGSFTLRFNFSHGAISNVNKNIEETFKIPEE